MTWTASLVVAGKDAAGLAEALGEDTRLAGEAVDAAEVAPGRWRVAVYLESEPDRAVRTALRRVAGSVLPGRAPDWAIERLPETDWVAKSLAGLGPVKVGRFLVHGSHDRALRKANDLAIEIEAGQAFGTGHHGTTAGCLAAIDRLARRRPIHNTLDIGTGSGVLAIAIAKRCRAPVFATDIDPVAVGVARTNARLNGVAPVVRTIVAAGVDRRDIARAGPFDLIVANILAGPLIALAPSIRRRLAPGGTVILSGLLTAQQNRVAAAYRAAGLRLTQAGVREGWATLTFTLPRPGGPPRWPAAGCSGSTGTGSRDRSGP